MSYVRRAVMVCSDMRSVDEPVGTLRTLDSRQRDKHV